MGLNTGKLPQGLIDEMMQDVKSDLANLTQFEQFCFVRDVDKRSGSLTIPVTPLEIAEDGHRTVKTAPNGETPRLNSEVSEFAYKSQDYKVGVDLEEGAEKELNFIDIQTQCFKRASSTILYSYNKDIAATLDTLTLGSLTAGAWNLSTSKPVLDWQPAIKNLKGVDELVCIMGFDVAQALSTNPMISGETAGGGTSVRSMQFVIDMIKSQGISEVYIDGSTAQSADGRQARSYKGAYDGKFAIVAKGNLFAARFIPLRVEAVEDKNRDSILYKAKHSHSIGRGFSAHGYYWTGILG